MAGKKPVFIREGRTVGKMTIEVPGPVESWDSEQAWNWPDWPVGPVGTSQTGGKLPRENRNPGKEGLNPLWYSFHKARTIIEGMRDGSPAGNGAPVYANKYPVSDENEMALNIKATAKYLGADLVGISKLIPERIKLGVILKEQEYVSRSFTHFIVLASEMDSDRFRTRILHHPGFSRPVRAPSAGADVNKLYFEMEAACIHLASYIRGLGYNAESQGPSRRVMNGPFANWSGIGETGRNNMVITPEFGSRVRLAGVLTDLPLTEDQPIDIGVQAYCESCKRCVRECPAKAITAGPKQLVRGVLKWPLNVKRCSEVGMAHSGEVGYGCQQCQVVCPYTRPSGYIDFDEHEEGENAVLGLWTELWHERGRADK